MPLPVSAIRQLRDAREIHDRYPNGEEFSGEDEVRWSEIHDKDNQLFTVPSPSIRPRSAAPRAASPKR